MIFGAASDVGLIRETNQDSLFIPDQDGLDLFIVADGMGGHNAGEIASGMAINKIREYISKSIKEFNNSRKILKGIVSAIEAANSHIYQYSNLNEGCSGMGTTVTMALIRNGRLFLGHVGDSRGYIVREGEIFRVTEDHSLVQELINKGSITEEEAKSHPQRNMITRAVGTDSGISVDTTTLNLKNGDIVVLCSDGLTNMVPEDSIANIFSKEEDIQKACDLAVEAAKIHGGKDNITVIGIKH